ncbi:MAG: hypothetical protein ACFHWZ_02855 [Phycisphaerales bacterium]
MTSTHLGIFLATIGAILLGTAVLHTLAKLGAAGRRASDALCRAPLLDLAITYFLILPGVVGAIVAGWLGLASAIAGQVVALQLWVWAHELAHPKARKGPRIVKSLNKVIGRGATTSPSGSPPSRSRCSGSSASSKSSSTRRSPSSSACRSTAPPIGSTSRATSSRASSATTSSGASTATG